MKGPRNPHLGDTYECDVRCNFRTLDVLFETKIRSFHVTSSLESWSTKIQALF